MGGATATPARLLPHPPPIFEVKTKPYLEWTQRHLK
ncbi:glutamate synthase Glt1 [Aspergillus luchuensis]|uniref:Glutamate synthase Glt1 n=1 Tax=Aspergillus kawachii TaxID=1069201 RepID=A0A146F7F0_ASPKA|nr:glutamate synthase Glt1 [Aspergillus luchuensis]